MLADTVGETDHDKAREAVGRLEARIDVLLAQLAHTDADNARWRQLRAMLEAEARLCEGLAAFSDLGADAPIRRVVMRAKRWLRRVEPALALNKPRADLTRDNVEVFAALRGRADERRQELQSIRLSITELAPERVARWAAVSPNTGLGVLCELIDEDSDPVADLLDDDIRSMLADAEAWCAPSGGRIQAALGLTRLAEAAVVGVHSDPLLDVEALLGRYAGAPEIYRLVDLKPEDIVSLDAVFARGAPMNNPAFRALERSQPTLVANVLPFFEVRMATATLLKLELPHRPFDALNIRLGASRMRTVAAALDGERLEIWFERLGVEPFARAIMQAGPPAVAQLTAQIDDVEALQSILTAFEPVGHALGALTKTVPASFLLELVENIGRPEMQRLVRALGADGLKHLVACVGQPGTQVLLSALPSDDLLQRLRDDLGRRSVRLTLEAVSGLDVARLLKRGLSGHQLQGIVLGAESRTPGLGAQVLGRLATMPGSDAQLQSRVATLNEAMAWPEIPRPRVDDK